MLRAGGSAVDACVAAAFASWVAEPALTGPGGGGFLVAYDAVRRRPLALDFFTAVPGAGHSGAVAPLEPYIVDFGTGRQTFLVGPGSCAVPGVTAGLEAAHRRLGRLPWAELTRPAIALARDGVEMTQAHADVIGLLTGFLGASPEGARIFGPSAAPCSQVTARATRRSPRRSSASQRTAPASSPTARRQTPSSHTRRPPAAASPRPTSRPTGPSAAAR